MITEIISKPIGFIESDLKQRYETPRQGVLAKGSTASINLLPKKNFEQAVKDLEGFDRIWVLYQFHLNKNWKPLVTPPRHTRKKIGVFATRAPYRPNAIGLSCVKLDKVDGLKIHISESDILDGSPVLDIKPYLPYSDSFPDSKTGWVKSRLENIYQVIFEKKIKELNDKLLGRENVNLLSYARVQLEFNPTDTTRKRISLSTKKISKENQFVLAYQKWRINYTVDEKDKKVFITSITTERTEIT
ncbi:MAG TPA: tRNA (N6-threonylcarbamoyladenosine(37)-N6)-methyltransferase TrmO [Ignavibacteriales bacterium]|nr:tRNA (N6-threonylcarbamoyladenosine(37)-N6)-methyltransferase TrmO [Ignavibacteriales bacterium]